jgi:hypothetical protein
MKRSALIKGGTIIPTNVESSLIPAVLDAVVHFNIGNNRVFSDANSGPGDVIHFNITQDTPGSQCVDAPAMSAKFPAITYQAIGDRVVGSARKNINPLITSPLDETASDDARFHPISQGDSVDAGISYSAILHENIPCVF